MEGTFEIYQAQSPCLDQAIQSCTQPGLGHIQSWGTHSFSGQPVPVVSPPHSKELLPYIQSKFTCFSLKLFPCPVSTGLGKKRLSIFLVIPLQVLKSSNKVFLIPSVLQDEQPQVSQPVFMQKAFRPSDNFHGPALDVLKRRSMSFPHGSVPSRSWNASHQVPWVCQCSSPSEGLKPDLLLRWVGLHPSSPCLEIQGLERCGTSS